MPEIAEADYIEVARRRLPKKVAVELASLAETTIGLQTRPVELAQSHESRLGGRPKLLPEQSWPKVCGRPMHLLVCLNLSDLGALDSRAELPVTGYLNIFFDLGCEQQPVGRCPEESFRVIHAHSGIFENRPTPAGALQHTAIAIHPTSQVSVPHPDEPAVAHLRDTYEAKMRAAHDDLIALAGVPRHRMLGWPDLLAGPMQPSPPFLRNGNWRLLLQLDSDPEMDWSWGQVGKLYLWIPEVDLAKARFNRCRLIIQSY